jgi:hypothetical protein
VYQLKIGDKYTSDDWSLLLSSFEIGSPQPKTIYIDIPSGDGSIDLTESLTGEVHYGNREITAKFTTKAPRSQWRSLFDTIKAYCHGRKYPIVIPFDNDHYYIGRVNVGPLIHRTSRAEFDVSITCDPYKYKNNLTSLTFTIGASGTLTTTLINSRKRVIPTITVSASTQVIFDDTSTTISAGTHKITNVVLIEGNNSITFNAAQGTTITVTYQEGAL